MTDALIMAAGRGSRLGDLTDDTPKSLIDLGGITPLELQLEVLIARGVSRAVLVTGYRRDLLQAAAERRAAGRIGLEFVFNPFWSVTNVLGSAWFARDRLDDDFVYAHADTVFDPTILDDCLAADADIALPVDMRAGEPEQMKAEVVGDRVLHLSKELPDERTAGEFIGIGLFRRRIVPGLVEAMEREVADGAIGSYFEAAINRLLADSGAEAVAVPTRGRAWTEIDFAEDLETARRLLPKFLEAPAT
ncbi:MAG TPA: phosphocholine cytidylyltransferase family protein [Candidatus Limnocylindria bacterium]|nr:phosphocholine cytidylyltransferase family protein [Candidatus Limnocylindria bacterium]